jgi:hypothetical protein
MTNEFPQTLVEAVRYFADPQAAFEFMVQLRWPDGVKSTQSLKIPSKY